MKTRINTTITKEILDKAKIRAVEEGIRTNELIEKALTNYLEGDMRMDRMSKLGYRWTHFDYDLRALEILDNDTDDIICTVYPDDVEDMELIKSELETSGLKGIEDWEDGRGNPVSYWLNEWESK